MNKQGFICWAQKHAQLCRPTLPLDSNLHAGTAQIKLQVQVYFNITWYTDPLNPVRTKDVQTGSQKSADQRYHCLMRLPSPLSPASLGTDEKLGQLGEGKRGDRK